MVRIRGDASAHNTCENFRGVVHHRQNTVKTKLFSYKHQLWWFTIGPNSWDALEGGMQGTASWITVRKEVQTDLSGLHETPDYTYVHTIFKCDPGN